MGNIEEAKQLLEEEGRPNRPDFDQLNNLSHVARLSRQEHISIREAMEYIKHMEQASAATLSLLENMKEEVNRANGPKSPCCGVATVWINAKQRYICPNCGNYPSEKPAEEIPIPDIKRKRCDFHEILHPDDIECPLCDGTVIKCTCGLIFFWEDAKEHFKAFKNHPCQIHVPVATKEREKEEK